MGCDEPPVLVYTFNMEKDLGNNTIMLRHMITSQVSAQNTQKDFERCIFHKGVRFGQIIY